MPNFDVRLSAGVTVQEWEDPRANPIASRPHRRYVGRVGVQIEARTRIAEGEAVLDSELYGNLFSSWLGEWPRPYSPPHTSSPSGQSSIQWFTPDHPGHYLWVIRLHDSGALGVHIDVRAA
jgi:hypothetical protein